MKKSWKKRTIASLLIGVFAVSSVAFAAEINPLVTASVNGDNVDVVARYENAENESADLWLFTVIYNADGTMKTVHFEESVAQGEMLASAAKEYSYPLADGETAKVFFWNDGTIEPYASVTNSAVELDITEDFAGLTILPAAEEGLTAPQRLSLPDGYIWDAKDWKVKKDKGDGTYTDQITLDNEANKEPVPGVEGLAMTTNSEGFTYTLSNSMGYFDIIKWSKAYYGGGKSDTEDTLCLDFRQHAPAYQRSSMSADFAPITSGEVEIEVRYLINEWNVMTNAANDDLATIKSSDGKEVVKVISLQNKLRVVPRGEKIDSKQDSDVITDKRYVWATLRYVIDMDKKTVKVYHRQSDDQPEVLCSFTVTDENGSEKTVTEMPFREDATDVASVYFAAPERANLGTTANNTGKYNIKSIKVKNAVPTRDITAIGATEAEAGDITTGQITQVDLGE